MRLALALGSTAAVLAAFPVPVRAGGAPPPGPPPAAIRVEPRSVELGMLYRGIKVRVEGTAPAGYRLALVCVGKEGRVELKRKGKVWNLLWRNVGTLAFERVPSLYHASADLDGAGLDHRSVPAAVRLGLGYDGIEAHVLPAHADESTRHLFRELVRLKVQERLYSFARLRPDTAPEEGQDAPGLLRARLGREVRPTRVSAEFSLPASIPPGVYEIRMIGYRDGTGEVLASDTLTAERVGVARLISSMAERHGLLHGILAVLLAVAAGFLSGVIFTGPKKGH
ncbi:MAG TPA: TIGR02186 family protein [Anaeromyxobacteraceae bacterium]|nr:TIGR02186 family protein [Anaeromyxobacteraceae bacterium]